MRTGRSGYTGRSLGTNGTGLACRTLGPHRSGNTRGTLRTGRPGYTGRPLGADGTRFTCRPLRTDGPGDAFGTLGSDRTSDTGNALGTGRPPRTHRPLRTGGTWGTIRAEAALLPVCTAVVLGTVTFACVIIELGTAVAVIETIVSVQIESLLILKLHFILCDFDRV